MRKVLKRLPQIDFVSIFSRRKRSAHSVEAHAVAPNGDKNKLRISARKTLNKYKKTFKKLAYE